MKAVHFLGNSKISLDDLPDPQPRGREVVVRVKSASICGTDRENLEGPGQGAVPGHENAGEVVAVDQPTRLKVGDRVAINCHITCGHCEHCINGDLYFCEELTVIGFDRDGGYADYLLVPEACCMPVTEDISFEAASLMVDMLGTPYRGLKRAQLTPGEKIAIWGAGPIGLGLLMIAKRFGLQAAVIDLSGYRLDLAQSFSPDLVLNPKTGSVGEALQDWTQGRGVAAAFECVGSEKAAQQALSVIKKRGKLVIVGVSHQLMLNPWDLICRELTLIGTRNFNTREFDEMAGLVRTGLPLTQVVTHRFPLAEAERAFNLFRSGESGKILIVDQSR
jgi:2-desacetyl-2-hydroxyethyl bacteriochlorophyllide A dehydrogenase